MSKTQILCLTRRQMYEVYSLMRDMEKDPLLELFIFETLELLRQLEDIVLNSEKTNGIANHIHEVFRIVHTIKGSAAMMNFETIASLTHSLEDMFYYLREKRPDYLDYAVLADLILKSIDFIHNEIKCIQSNHEPEGDVSALVLKINNFLSALKNENEDKIKENNVNVINMVQSNAIESSEKSDQEKTYKARIFFEDGCEMENIRAFNALHQLGKVANIISYDPADIIENEGAVEAIRKKGFEIVFSADISIDDVKSLLSNTLFMKDIKLESVSSTEETVTESEPTHSMDTYDSKLTIKQSMISIKTSKLDVLMDLVSELVITQAMVIQHPELKGLSLSGFDKSARQLQKITNEIQDMVMSVRMVPLLLTFQKMHRLVRDMGKKLGKETVLQIKGEDTEVDKNIIEHLSDPLIHLIRNAMDHGIETVEKRLEQKKSRVGKITLEAKNEGGDVWIIVSDDGKGIDKEKVLQKAKRLGLLRKPENKMTDKEIYSFIFSAGFSTKQEVTEFSGRGVGMDVVTKGIEEVGGTIRINSAMGKGTRIEIKIPLTLTIIDGMKVRVGKSIYIIPITAIREAYKIEKTKIIKDEMNKSEMLMLRGNCYPVLRLYNFFKIPSDTKDLEEGIIILIEHENKILCLFADELMGEQQVVVKPLPRYIKKLNAVSGCTVMHDGSVSLIIDVSWFFHNL